MIKTMRGAPGVGGLTFGGTGADSKGSVRQSLGPGIAARPPTITPGHPLGRLMGQYGKSYAPPPGLGDVGGSGTSATLNHPGAQMIRGESGGMKTRIKQGGLGAGRLGGFSTGSVYGKDDSE
jgi:hypothetical protein